MSEKLSSVPSWQDDLAFLDDEKASKANQELSEAPDAARIQEILPTLPENDRRAVLESLGTTGTLEQLLALFVDPAKWAAVRTQFRIQVEEAKSQTLNNQPVKIDNWLPEFIEGFSKDTTETKKEEIRSEVNQENEADRRDSFTEQLKDIRTFESILEKNPEILDKLKAQGIDLNAERGREREKLKQENPGMSESEIESRSALAVYLKHQDVIVAAAPDDSVRKELDAGFDRLRSHARDAGIPYQETIRNAAGILPTDKAAIMMATSATLDTRVTRVWNALYFDSPGDQVRQVWTVRPGERPEKSVDIPGGPSIKIAAAPEPDLALIGKKHQALDKVAEITGYQGARTPGGLEVIKRHFPKHLEATKISADSVLNTWKSFVDTYAKVSAQDRVELVKSMRESVSWIMDPQLKSRTSEALDDFLDSAGSFGDENLDLLQEIGKQYAGTIGFETFAAKDRVDKKLEAFEQAIRDVDQLTKQEQDALKGFQEQTKRSEEIARDNLSYFDENWFRAFDPHFELFLATINAHQVFIYPDADGKITLPKVLTEKDRAFFSHGLTKAMDKNAKVEEYFTVPGYRLKQADEAGVITTERIRAKLQESGVIKDGAFQKNTLESRFAGSEGNSN